MQKLQEFQDYIVDSGEDFLVGLLSQWGRNNGSEIVLQFSDPTFVQEFEQLSSENNWVLFGRGIADIASIVQSLAEISAGGTIAGGGAAAAPVSGGTSLVLTASGVLVIAHGTAVGTAASADLGEVIGELSDDLTQQIFENRNNSFGNSSVGNMKEFFDTDFGSSLSDSVTKTSKKFQGQSIYEVTQKPNHDILKKGDKLYLDNLHKNHLEVFDKKGRIKAVLNLDGTVNTTGLFHSKK